MEKLHAFPLVEIYRSSCEIPKPIRTQVIFGEGKKCNKRHENGERNHTAFTVSSERARSVTNGMRMVTELMRMVREIIPLVHVIFWKEGKNWYSKRHGKDCREIFRT
jgi:hypothetical protein